MSKSKIVLKNIDLEKIHTKYNINFEHLDNAMGNTKTDITRIEDIFKSSNNQTMSFLNETYAKKIYDISTVNPNAKYHCFWDHHPFSTYPIYCPIMYNSEKLEKVYTSNINKNTYNIKEDVIQGSISSIDDIRIKKIRNAYYITDGYFCSFNCAQAFIDDNKHNDLYDYSSLLLVKLYNYIYPDKPVKNILSAPHWRCLDVYTGKLDIAKFRESFNIIEYKYKGLNFNHVNHLFEEKLRISS